MMDQSLTLSSWFQALRPKTLFVSLSSILWAIILVQPEQIDWTIFWLTLGSCTCMQIAANLVNDYWDGQKGIDSSERLGPKRMTHIDPKGFGAQIIRYSYYSFFVLAFLLGVPLLIRAGWPILILGLSSLLMAYTYSAGPKPYSHLMLGEFFAFLFFGPVAVLGSFYLQTLSINGQVFLLSIIPGLISFNLMAINNLRDQESDRKTSKKTLVMAIGSKSMRNIMLLNYLVILSLVTYLGLILNSWTLIILAMALSLCFFIPITQIIYFAPLNRLNKALGLNALSGFVLSVVFFLFAHV